MAIGSRVVQEKRKYSKEEEEKEEKSRKYRQLWISEKSILCEYTDFLRYVRKIN